MANIIYNSFKGGMDGSVAWDDGGSTFKVMLVTSEYTPNPLNDFISDVTDEVTGTGYTAGGATLTGRAVTIDDSNNLAKYDGDDVVWASSSITARGAVIYRDTGVSTTSPLVAYIDFGADKTATNGDFTIQWSADGVFTIA